ncbi:SNF2 DNA/RNA helicase [Encephalitozoon intestinalis ATCC 50506]|uniref:SNF2 DNA/RNA helicase n=1 Tax=Encephalitozoon intestinalis (strain ATCC 50506) TaxID=876142 RepID=E0S9R7_ENCIT|nr:SNF2 DNA/RNA helicase [Encephalitozoon intestinalis ATCC 50506]ADM12452.1 SNF2 DNA/RNA helicase [Encephalitozoon intestinalis ATCC 50506]UTX46288.1 Snf2/Rad54-like helicase [Encephalitozoon intestinalis]
MNVKLLRKYKSFIGDNEFFRAFIPNYEDVMKGDDEPIEPYTFISSPKFIIHELKDYQIEGLNWLINMHENSINCILADEMGLGKTLQTIAFLGYIRYVKKERKRHLIVLPKSTLANWKREFRKFMPNYKARIFYSSRKEMKREAEEIMSSKWDACLTTYEMCINAKNILSKVNWSYIIIDEAHRIKNEHSLLSKIVRIFSCDHRLLITGTPLQNNVHELWALLNFIVPEIFNDAEKFENYVMSIEEEDGEAIKRIRNVLQLFFLRREKIDVEKGLIPKKIINLYSKLSPMQREWYKMLLKRDLSPLGSTRDPKGMLMNVVMQLRKCCNHPYLFPDAEPEPYTNDKHIIENSGKMIVLDKLLESLRARGSRVLIFSQMSMMLDILEDYAMFKEYEYCRIDGSTSYKDRTEAIDAFNAEGSEKFIFLLTTRAGGLGINLSTADTVILFDSDWNPQMDLQAQDRAHRIGQKKQVVVFRLISENTVEERIVYRSLQKLKLDDILLQGRCYKSSGVSQSELIDILANGMEITEDEEKDENIEDLIRRGEEKTREMNMKLCDFKISDTLNTNIDCYTWEGEDYNIKKIENFIESNQDAYGRSSRTSVLFRTRPRIIEYPEYQFYPRELMEIQEKEIKLYEEGKSLSPDEVARKKELQSQGFDWTKKDFQSYVKAMEKVGKDDVSKIAMLMKHKNDVEAYHKVFWERVNELRDAEKIISSIEKSQKKMERRSKIREMIEGDFDSISAKLGKTRSRLGDYNPLLIDLYRKYIDHPNWVECIRKDILKLPEYKFDYYLLSRTNSDIQKHINHLISALAKYCKETKDTDPIKA